MNGRVPSNFDELDILSERYPFLPNSLSSRPPPEAIARKKETLESIQSNWRTITDYISATVFGCPSWFASDGKMESTCRIAGLKKFQVSPFPYQIRSGYHYVMWYGTTGAPPDEEINADITRSIQEIIGTTEHFSFGWYENPKMSIPEVYHVQVFWDV